MTSAADLTGVQVIGTYSTGTNLQGTGTHHAAYPKMAFTSTVSGSQDSTVTVNPATVYQQFDGIGFSLEETTIHNLWQLSKERREQLLTTIVKDMKIDVFRMVIGCCDCNYRYPFWSNDIRSYAKTSEGQYDLDVEDDFDLDYFSIQMDHDLHVVETVQFIRSLNPNVKFFASAWSPPSWMKEIRYMKQGTNKYCDFELNEDGSYKVM
jgi:glucosylceramidase